MDVGTVHELPVHPRHFALDERGVGLRATWHAERGLVNLSLWSGNRCVQTFHMTPVEAGRLIGFLAGVLADAAPGPALAVVPEGEDERRATRLERVRGEVAAMVERAARRLRA